MVIDAHTHLWDRQFDRDRDEVIRRMRDLGIGAVQVGTDRETSESALRLAETNENFWASVGQHPTDTKNVFDEAAFEALARRPKAVAIGECGLDYYRAASEEERERQADLFRLQIALAKRVSKPLMIHCRPTVRADRTNSTDAYDDVFRILQDAGLSAGEAGVLHFFAGSREVAEKFLDIGFLFSFSGVITITQMYDDVARFIPADRVLIETDAPYAAPLSHRGKRNEPAYIIETAQRLAEIRSASSEEIMRIVAENTMRIFKITV